MVLVCHKHADPCPYLRTRPHQAREEHFEDTIPMDNQPRNVNESDEWVGVLPQDGPHGNLGPNGGGSGLADLPWHLWSTTMEPESKCMAIISSKIIGGSVHVDVTLTCRYLHDKQ